MSIILLSKSTIEAGSSPDPNLKNLSFLLHGETEFRKHPLAGFKSVLRFAGDVLYNLIDSTDKEDEVEPENNTIYVVEEGTKYKYSMAVAAKSLLQKAPVQMRKFAGLMVSYIFVLFIFQY